MINEKVRKIRQRRADTAQRNRSVNKFIYIKLKFRRLLYFLAGIKLKKLSAKCRSVEDCLNLVASFNYSFLKLTTHVLIWAMQRRYEIRKFLKIFVNNRPKTILEIGTASGGTTFLLTRLSDPNALILSLDLSARRTFREIFCNRFAMYNQKIFFLQRDSHKLSTLEELKKLLKNRQIDVLFIDGDHSYEGVKKDFEMYSPLVKKNGIIAFHDIVKVSPDFAPDVEVNKFWNEIKENYDYKELVEDWNQEWGGIGLIKIK